MPISIPCDGFHAGPSRSVGWMEGPCCGLKGVGLGPGSGGTRLEQVLFRRGVWVLVAHQGRNLVPGLSLGVLGVGIAALSHSFQSRDVL